jgi:hypothetical protein
MSLLRDSDEPMHYSDGSHRWAAAPEPEQQDAWMSKVKAHVEEHQRNPNAGYIRRGPRGHQLRLSAPMVRTDGNPNCW